MNFWKIINGRKQQQKTITGVLNDSFDCKASAFWIIPTASKQTIFQKAERNYGGKIIITHGSLDKILFHWLFSGLSSDQTKQLPCAMKSNPETGYTVGELAAPVSGRSVVSGRKKVEKPLCTYIIVCNNYHYSFSHSLDLGVATQKNRKR